MIYLKRKYLRTLRTVLNDSETKHPDTSDEGMSDGSFMGKDKETKWFKMFSSIRVSAKFHKTFIKPQRVLKKVRNVRMSLECWRNPMTEGTYSIQSFFRTLFYLYLAGVWRNNRKRFDHLCGTDNGWWS